MFVLLFIALWSFIGAASIIYWWTKDYDFTTDDMPLLFIGMAGGPLSFIAGWIASTTHTTKTLFKRRK